MVPLASLWLPVVVAAVLVFVASTVIHMFLGYHSTDFGPVPDENRVMGALREAGVEKGQYVLPHASDRSEMQTPEFEEKAQRGPVGFLTVLEGWPPNMALQFVLWFVFSLVVGVFAAYLAGRALGPGAPYLDVFRFTGTVAFVGYAVAGWQESIWYGRTWSTTLKHTLDGLIYALLTAGVFGWLWPG